MLQILLLSGPNQLNIPAYSLILLPGNIFTVFTVYEMNLISRQDIFFEIGKVHIFWEGHKIYELYYIWITNLAFHITLLTETTAKGMKKGDKTKEKSNILERLGCFRNEILLFLFCNWTW